jgi:hypothetical protein
VGGGRKWEAEAEAGTEEEAEATVPQTVTERREETIEFQKH